MGTRFGEVDFDERLLDALRDERLVVFAGAGVSMGAPSSLPNFPTLVSELAAQAGRNWNKKDGPPADRFLGELKLAGTPIHELAARRLRRPGSAPKNLHKDLLRLFQNPDRVRVVTTNFDCHFETAAREVFALPLPAFTAPALPLGGDFCGLVKLHGTLDDPRRMVLTDEDFGRAYLTQGWARRFLVDLFQSYTVLFVGYSHDDVVVSYLARSLPSGGRPRFALHESDGASWRHLGIQQLRFQLADEGDPYAPLNGAVSTFADEANLGVLDWEARLKDAAGRPPPIDDQEAAFIERGLRELSNLRFLTDAAQDAAWPMWLHARGHLAPAFADNSSDERTDVLCNWLSCAYARSRPTVLLNLLAHPGARLGARLWFHVCRELSEVPDDFAGQRHQQGLWQCLLEACPDDRHTEYSLVDLATGASRRGWIHLVVDVFLVMCRHRLVLRPWGPSGDVEGDDLSDAMRSDIEPLCGQWALNEVWQKHLRPRLSEVAEALLRGLGVAIGAVHRQEAVLLGRSPDDMPFSFRTRAAIEPSESDKYPEPLDVMTDAARDALAHLADGQSPSLQGWCDAWVHSEVPLLRRLAVHAVAENPSCAADARISWLLDCCDLYGEQEHHEVHRLVRLNFAEACDEVRARLVERVMAYVSRHADPEAAAAIAAEHQLNWLSWLARSKPDCPFVAKLRPALLKQFPNYSEPQRLDLQSGVDSDGELLTLRSPWTKEALLSRTAGEWLDKLLSFQTEGFWGPSREDGLNVLRETVAQAPAWGLELGRALQGRTAQEPQRWHTDLWPSLLMGLTSSPVIDEPAWREALTWARDTRLQEAHPEAVVRLLHDLTSNGGKPFALELLDPANELACSLWTCLPEAQPEPVEEGDRSWLSEAINRPAGQLMLFWVNGLSLSMRGREGADRILPETYGQWFDSVLASDTRNGGLARAVLASQTAFLLGLDASWTCKQVLPLFSAEADASFAQAWDGFLVWGRLSAGLTDELLPAFRAGIERVQRPEHARRRDRFVQCYTDVVALHPGVPRDEFIANLLRKGSLSDACVFAQHLASLLRRSKPEHNDLRWQQWVESYWDRRLKGLPIPLRAEEVGRMVDWLPALDEAFPAAVERLCRSPRPTLGHCSLLFDLRAKDCSLPTRYPEPTADVLIYLARAVTLLERRYLREVADRLQHLEAVKRLELEAALRAVGV